MLPGTAGINAPTAVFVLVAHHLSERAAQPAGIAALKQRMQQDVVGLEHGVGFEFAAPVAVGVLQTEEKIARAGKGRVYVRHVRVNAAKFGAAEFGLSESGRCGLCLLLLWMSCVLIRLCYRGKRVRLDQSSDSWRAQVRERRSLGANSS